MDANHNDETPNDVAPIDATETQPDTHGDLPKDMDAGDRPLTCVKPPRNPPAKRARSVIPS